MNSVLSVNQLSIWSKRGGVKATPPPIPLPHCNKTIQPCPPPPSLPNRPMNKFTKESNLYF